MFSVETFVLMFMWYPLNNGYIAFCGINVKVLPSKFGHLSTISLSKMAISANFISDRYLLLYLLIKDFHSEYLFSETQALLVFAHICETDQFTFTVSGTGASWASFPDAITASQSRL
jgi:hypothetical protein